jgi:hypothetical protein
MMLKSKEKAEIRTYAETSSSILHEFDLVEALSTFGFQFLTQEYLPQKLKEGDWI